MPLLRENGALGANAQFAAPEDELVDSVRKVLWRHGAANEA
jgi:hypothetical protein